MAEESSLMKTDPAFTDTKVTLLLALKIVYKKVVKMNSWAIEFPKKTKSD